MTRTIINLNRKTGSAVGSLHIHFCLLLNLCDIYKFFSWIVWTAKVHDFQVGDVMARNTTRFYWTIDKIPNLAQRLFHSRNIDYKGTSTKTYQLLYKIRLAQQ